MKSNQHKIFLVSVFIVIVYVLWQWIYLKLTKKAPFCILLNESNDNCWIYFNIEHQGRTYPIIYPYFFAVDRFVSPKFRSLAPFYFNEIIKWNLSITVDDSDFSQVKYGVVDTSLVKQYINRQLVSDSTIIMDDNSISRNVTVEERKAIIYSLLKQGVNCCPGHDSGDTFVTSCSDGK